ncbi:hypothetical protein F383_24928 [Gossypium arboreum]|uniref:Uncharacterized protein n=1 Tax=Gossypium arboreum TaxID=29729 RepID=A0A0B0MT26_GOSAR|nr:hypothetical protein F383_24928 [Gossypium arboreum]
MRMCYELVQVYSASSGWRSSKILSHYQAIIWGISLSILSMWHV